MNPDLWRALPGLALLSWLPVPIGTLALWLPAWPPFARRFSRPWASWAFFLLTRVALGAIVLFALGHRSVDWSYFDSYARSALAGKIPYRDFPLFFAPGLPYVFALGYLLSPAWGMLALFVLADFGAFLTLTRLSGGAAPRADSAAWAYVAFPPVWFFEVRYSQEESIAALWAALALLALVRRRDAWAGAALAAGQLGTKILFGLAALPLLVARRRTATWIVYAAPVAAVYGLMTVAKFPWWREAGAQAAIFGAGPTLWRLPSLWLGFDLGRFAYVPFAVAFTAGWVRLLRRGADGVDLAAWLWGCFALLAPKVVPMYVVIVSPLLALWVARGGRARFAWWGLYGLVFASVWYADSGPVQGLFGPWGVAAGAAILMMAVALDVWLLASVWRVRGREERARRGPDAAVNPDVGPGLLS